MSPSDSTKSFFSTLISKLRKNSKHPLGEDEAEAEILKLISQNSGDGTVSRVGNGMIENIFEFDDTTVDEICTHRKDIFALPADTSFDEAIRAAAMERYTRIPVYTDNIDNIIGIMHIKDLFKVVLERLYNSNDAPDNFDLRSVIHKPYFVPLSKTTDQLFLDMQKNKVHIAIIVDEYGGTAGLVTMEDLIEEVMGNIQDEYDGEEIPEINPIANNTYEISGSATLETVSKYFGCPMPVDDYDTLGGFLIGQLGRVPNDSEQPQVEYEGLLFKVSKIEDRRVSIVIACKL